MTRFCPECTLFICWYLREDFFFSPHVYQYKLCRRACVVERITRTRRGDVAGSLARNQDPLDSNHNLQSRFYVTPLEKAIIAGEGLHTLYYLQDKLFRPFITRSTACISQKYVTTKTSLKTIPLNPLGQQLFSCEMKILDRFNLSNFIFKKQKFYLE